MELQALYDSFEFEAGLGRVFSPVSGWDTGIEDLLRERPSAFVCPSDTAEEVCEYARNAGTSSYSMVAGTNGPTGYGGNVKYTNTGMFGYYLPRELADALDGTSNTLAIGEVRDGHLDSQRNVWILGSRLESNHRTTRNPINTPPGTGIILDLYGRQVNAAFSSYHPGGANFLLLDGSVHFVSETLDQATYNAYATRQGKETVSGI